MTMRRTRAKTRPNVFKAGRTTARRSRPGLVRRLLRLGGALGLLAALTLVLIFVHDWTTQTGLLRVTAVEVEGAVKLSPEEVRTRAGIAAGDNLLAANLGAARRRLLAHPWVAAAAVKREIPNRIVIRIKEHECLAVLALDQGYLLDTEGQVFKAREPGEGEDRPVISGLDYPDLGSAEAPPSEGLAAVVALLRLPLNKVLPGAGLQVRTVRTDPDGGLRLTVDIPGLSPDPVTLILGRDQWERKLAKLDAILRYVQGQPDRGGLRCVNLKNLDRIVVSRTAALGPTDSNKEV